MQEEKKDLTLDAQNEAKKIVLKQLEDTGVISYMRAKIKKSVIDILDNQSDNMKQKLEFDYMTPLHRLNKSKEIILAGHLIKQFLEYYKLDGYVTEHIQINRDISQLYKYLITFENDNNRIFAMLERRINLLEPINNEINHKLDELNIKHKLFIIGGITGR